MTIPSSVWIPLSKRSQEIQQKVGSIFDTLADKQLVHTSLDLYEDLEWGLLEQSDLYRGLIECSRLSRCLTKDEMLSLTPKKINTGIPLGVDEEIYNDTTKVDIPPSDVEGKPLAWFVAHPPNHEIRDKASDILDQRILDLYVTHVNETGETYFPQIESQLRAYYDFLAD